MPHSALLNALLAAALLASAAASTAPPAGAVALSGGHFFTALEMDPYSKASPTSVAVVSGAVFPHSTADAVVSGTVFEAHSTAGAVVAGTVSISGTANCSSGFPHRRRLRAPAPPVTPPPAQTPSPSWIAGPPADAPAPSKSSALNNRFSLVGSVGIGAMAAAALLIV